MNCNMRAIGVLTLLFYAIGLNGIQIVAAHESVAGTAGRVTKEAKDALDATRRYTIEQKDAFEKQVRSELDAIQAGISTLQGKINQASDETRADLQRAIDQLESKKTEAGKKLEDLHRATASTWSNLRDGMTDLLREVKRSYREAVSALP
jgi:peptidoglycan hydrolase CwlO-like protein